MSQAWRVQWWIQNHRLVQKALLRDYRSTACRKRFLVKFLGEGPDYMEPQFSHGFMTASWRRLSYRNDFGIRDLCADSHDVMSSEQHEYRNL